MSAPLRAGARDPPPEIAFLERHGVSRDELLRIADLAERLGVSPEEALLGENRLSEKAFYRALADHLGLPYCDGAERAAPDSEPEAAILHGFARLAPNPEGKRVIVAPRGPALRLLIESAARAERPLPVVIASRQRLSACLRAQFSSRIAHRAAHIVHDRDPALSAKALPSRWQIAALAAVLGLVALGVATAPTLLRVVVSLLFWIVFSGAVWLRSMAVGARGVAREERAPEPDDASLPVYTVIAALHREGPVVAQLVRALCALDYPGAKLDIKIVVEEDDDETYAALAQLRLPPWFDVILAPRGEPQTKPRALNVALAVARGQYVAVYDAEDRPAPGQLRAAAGYFAEHPEVDGLQAGLAIENAGDSWLSRMFAIEYAVLFDIFNPGLAALRLPIALGGTSNHIRLRALRRAGGWDAWNVTEDADLGLRLARFGFEIQTLASDTIEEAPHEFRNWLRQRVRWQKGWMQTVIVHTREPAAVWRQLGGWGALSAAALFVGGLSGGLFGTLFFSETFVRLALAAFVPGYADLWYGDIVTIGLLLWGVQSLVVPAALAMRRRRMSGLGRALLGMPAYYALITLATWQALFELVFRPHHWGKTDHGREKARLARTGLGARPDFISGSGRASRA